MDFLIDFFTENFQNCVWVAAILIALCPTLESKIAIPLAMNTAFWGGNSLSPIFALFVGFIGSILPCYFAMILARKIKSKATGFVSSKLIEKYSRKSQNILLSNSNFKKYLMLATFVAVPLPLTGVWSGSLIAGFSGLDLKYSFIAIAIGAFISAAAITILCTVFENSIPYILMISLLIVIVVLTVSLLFDLFKSKKKV